MRKNDAETVRKYADVYVDFDYPWEPIEIETDMREAYEKGEEPFLSGMDPEDLDSFIRDVIKENDKLMKGYFNAN